MSVLQQAAPAMLELTAERESRLQSALADLYYSDPQSYDWMGAMMNRITTLEKKVIELERQCDSFVSL